MSFPILPADYPLPIIVAPMFLVSTEQMVLAACRAGVMAAFPLTNAPSIEDAERVVKNISTTLETELKKGEKIGAWILNQIVHSSYTRFEAEAALIAKYKPPIVITALGNPQRIIPIVHAYGGKVWADVNSLYFAKKAAAAGVDGLILLCAGAGGHTGHLSPFAFLAAIRSWFKKTLILSGGIMDGNAICAAQILGADFAYMGTRFIASPESMATDSYKKMLIDCHIDQVITTKSVTGVAANFLEPSLKKLPTIPDTPAPTTLNFSERYEKNKANTPKAWRDIFSAGHGVGTIQAILPISESIAELRKSYEKAKNTARELL